MAGLLDAVEGLVNKVKGIKDTKALNTTGGTLVAKKPLGGLLYPVGQEQEEWGDWLPAHFNKSKQAQKFLMVDPQNWYKMYPYQFAIVVTDAVARPSIYKYTLPIPPEALSIKMISASEATPTFGGVVEESSQNKFWTISLSGTTGIAPSRGGQNYIDTSAAANQFRQAISTTGLLSGILGNVESLGSKAVNVANSAIGGFNALTSNPLSAGADLADLAASVLMPNLPYTNSAVDRKSNGYSEIARLHKFFYMYSVLKDKIPHKTALTFRNLKDGMTFRCIVKDFTIQKSVQDPFLYRYSIQLKCWTPGGATDSKDTEEIDRFKNGGDLHAVNTMTLTGMYSQGVKTMQSFNFGKSNVPGII